MSARVAINGFGRTGRQSFKAIWAHHRDRLEVAAIGVAAEEDAAAAAHLLQYDSNYGRFGEQVRVHDSELRVGSARIPLVSASRPAELPWADLGVDVVIEASGVWVNGPEAGHLDAGAGKVVVASPSEAADLMVIFGVNHGDYDPARHHIVSAGSDTTNALAALMAVLREGFDVRNAMVTAVRAYTNAQKLLDFTDTDLRRARSAPASIVPTTTRAATAIGTVFPDMAGRLGGYAVRVPVPTVSILELIAHLGEPADANAVNDAFRTAAAGPLAGILGVCDLPLVSSDYKGERRSAVVDAPLTMTVGNLLKVSAWYDNEWGYSNRVADIAALLANGHPRDNGRAG
jgi:glyceraldehyde 3-phosphate dehydrogenase